MVEVTRQPFDPGPAGWNEILPPHPGFAALETDESADVLIIGGGFTGLSAARRLFQLDPKLRIVLLEARRMAEGPAGRNSGFMIDLPHNLSTSNYAGQAELDREKTQVNRAAIAFARDAADEYAMPREAFAQSGKINAAATNKGHRKNLAYAEHLKGIGETCDLLDETEMQKVCGSDYYRSGLYTPGTAMLQPALYVRSLADGLARVGVAVFENSPAIGFEKSGAGWQVETPQGKVKANKVILATNGHAESFGFFKRKLIHIYLYASMTRALSDDEIRRLGGEEHWGLTPADPAGSTIRKISGPDGTRILIRNSISWAPKLSVPKDRHLAFANVHDRSFAARFPMLNGVEMEFRWGGQLCLSQNAAPAFGEVEKGLFSACCQNGLGTAFGTASGVAVAEKIIGHRSATSDFLGRQVEPSKLPHAMLASIGAHIHLRWAEFKAGKEL